MTTEPTPVRGVCILWSGPIASNGYGKRQVHGRTVGAHRVAWEEANGPIPDGLFVLHRCDNPPCCNVEHLFLGTHVDNMRDMASKGRGVVRRGADHPNCSLTEEQVQLARQLYRDGVKQSDISRRFGIGKATASRLVRGVTHGAVAGVHAGFTDCRACGRELLRQPVTRKFCNKLCQSRARRKVLSDRSIVDGRLIATNGDRHGCVGTYTNYGCRCEPCTSAASEYMRRYRGRRR